MYCIWRVNTAHHRVKGKAIPVTGRGGPQGCKTSGIPHFLENRPTDGGEVVSLMHRSPFTRFLVLFPVRGWVNPRATVWLEGLGQLKNPMTSWGCRTHTGIYLMEIWKLNFWWVQTWKPFQSVGLKTRFYSRPGLMYNDFEYCSIANFSHCIKSLNSFHRLVWYICIAIQVFFFNVAIMTFKQKEGL
jgi:hypothetical protein